MAARLLRVNILAPITGMYTGTGPILHQLIMRLSVQTSIDARLDVVEELVQDEDLFNEVRSALKTLNSMDFDKLIATVRAFRIQAVLASTIFLSLLRLKPYLQTALKLLQTESLRC